MLNDSVKQFFVFYHQNVFNETKTSDDFIGQSRSMIWGGHDQKKGKNALSFYTFNFNIESVRIGTSANTVEAAKQSRCTIRPAQKARGFLP